MCNLSEVIEEKSIAKGRAEGRAEIIARLLQKGKAPKEIAELLDFDLAEVEKVEKSLLATAE